MVAAGKMVVGGGISGPVAALTEGMVKTMGVAKMKWVALMLLAAVLSATAGWTLAYRPRAAQRKGSPPGAAVVNHPRPAADRKGLQGGWALVHGEIGGKRDAAELENFKSLLITKSELFYLWKPGVVPYYYRLQWDGGKKLRTLSLLKAGLARKVFPGAVLQPGIYRQDRDLLKICFDRSGKKRPVAFKTARGSNEVLLVLKRTPAPRVPEVGGLSCRLSAPAQLSSDVKKFKVELLLSNVGKNPLRIGTLCQGWRGSGQGWYEEVFRPDRWKSDRPRAADMARQIVTLQPGKIFSFPIELDASNYRHIEFLKIEMGYETAKSFAATHQTWAGSVRANPVLVRIKPAAEDTSGQKPFRKGDGS
jgi:uncharacterized protein (TIGR03067 family)